MLDNHTKSCVVCGLHKPLRNNYFDGKMLYSRDFSDEQDYNRGHRQLHNTLLHGTGTVCGLKIIQHPAPDCRDKFVVVEPGMALDCCGQEIIMPERTLVRVREMVEADTSLQERLDGSNDLIIALRRCDQGAEPMPVILPGCDGEMGATEYGRICEGYEFVISARAHSDGAALAAPAQPKLEWVHTITLGAQAPKALHINDGEHLLQIAADNDSGGAHLYAHSLQTQDLVSLLEGPEQASDTGSAREARLVFAAGGNFSANDNAPGIGVWHADQIEDDATPVAVITTRSDHARIAVSPTSGTLFVLDQTTDNATRLVSYSADEITTWLGSGPGPGSAPVELASLSINQNFGGQTSAYRRGASMMRVSHDGRFLAILAQQPHNASTNPLYLIDISAFNEGIALPDARATTSDLDLSGDHVFCSLAWSLDDAFLYVLSTTDGDGDSGSDDQRLFLNRYALTGTGNTLEQRGRGVALRGAALDLALAPTERRIYLLMTNADDETVFTSVDNERVKALSDEGPELIESLDGAVEIDGMGQNVALLANGSRAFVAAADAEPEGLPDRGLVAVIDISEDDCAVHFDDQINGCPACDDSGDHVVILGHLDNYDFAADPKMMNAGEAGDADAVIDNRTYRQIVPSAATLKMVVDCILEQGIAEGPPGPRGDPGDDGTDGANGADGTDGTNGTDGTDGTDGADGRSINDVDVNMIAPGAPATGSTTIVSDTDMLLTLNIPGAQAGGGLPEVISIIGLSWPHGGFYPGIVSQDFFDVLRRNGIAVGFDKEVPWQQFVPNGKIAQPTMLVELQRKVEVGGNASVWAAIDNLVVSPIRDLTPAGGTLLTDWDIGFSDGDFLTQGFAITAARNLDTSFDPNETLRLVFYTDFVVDESGDVAIDGSHLGGRLPTGRGAPGDTFRSWFRFNDSQ
jgi:hypothetical protein